MYTPLICMYIRHESSPVQDQRAEGFSRLVSSLRRCARTAKHGGFLSHGGTPKSFNSRHDHNLVLKPMVTWGYPMT